MYFTINKDKTKLYELEFYRRRFNIFIDMCNYHLWLIMSDFESYLIDYKITKNLVVVEKWLLVGGQLMLLAV